MEHKRCKPYLRVMALRVRGSSARVGAATAHAKHLVVAQQAGKVTSGPHVEGQAIVGQEEANVLGKRDGAG